MAFIVLLFSFLNIRFEQKDFQEFTSILTNYLNNFHRSLPIVEKFINDYQKEDDKITIQMSVQEILNGKPKTDNLPDANFTYYRFKTGTIFPVYLTYTITNGIINKFKFNKNDHSKFKDCDWLDKNSFKLLSDLKEKNPINYHEKDSWYHIEEDDPITSMVIQFNNRQSNSSFYCFEEIKIESDDD